MKKKIIIGILLYTVIFTSIPVQAAPLQENVLKEKIVETTELLEEVLKNEYESHMQSIKQEIYSGGYEYSLSMETLAEKDSPYAEADYLELIAAYLTISDNTMSICDIDFYCVDTEPVQYTSVIPYKTYEYEENTDGTYRRKNVKYITEECDTGIYTENEDGTYSYSGEEHICPEEEVLEYLDITIDLITAEEMLEKYGNEDKGKEYKSRLTELKKSGVSAEGLQQSIMLNGTYNETLDPEALEALEKALEEVSGNRLAILECASSLIGLVPYQWGGKADGPGIDPSWWTFENGEQKGLDCSGFVSWVYQTVGYENYMDLYSTGEILATTETIAEDELQIGDIGLLNGGETVNHTGIYIGDGYFIHCSSGANTVTVSKFPFTIFKRARQIDSVDLNYECEQLNNAVLTEDEIYLIAQTVSNEARGEGLNGWIAVTEVILNRINSESFPNIAEEVIYQNGQFADNERIKTQVPTDAIISAVRMTAEGRISVLNDPDILYFRNAGEEGVSDWGSLVAVKKVNNHTFYKKTNVK